MKKIKLAGLGLFFILSCSILTFAQNKEWIGKYENAEDGMNAGGTRSYSTFHNLQIMEEDGVLTAIYESGENSDIRQNMKLTVQLKGNTASFFYDHCFSTDEDSTEPCSDSEKQGTLMFKLVKSLNKNKKKTLLTYGVKNDLLPKGEVFFKKVS